MMIMVIMVRGVDHIVFKGLGSIDESVDVECHVAVFVLVPTMLLFIFYSLSEFEASSVKVGFSK